MNKESSRSHSVFTLTVQAVDTGQDGLKSVRSSQFHLVDLAGAPTLTSPSPNPNPNLNPNPNPRRAEAGAIFAVSFGRSSRCANPKPNPNPNPISPVRDP